MKPAVDNINVAGYRFYIDGVLKGEYIRKMMIILYF